MKQVYGGGVVLVSSVLCVFVLALWSSGPAAPRPKAALFCNASTMLGDPIKGCKNDTFPAAYQMVVFANGLPCNHPKAQIAAVSSAWTNIRDLLALP